MIARNIYLTSTVAFPMGASDAAWAVFEYPAARRLDRFIDRVARRHALAPHRTLRSRAAAIPTPRCERIAGALAYRPPPIPATLSRSAGKNGNRLAPAGRTGLPGVQMGPRSHERNGSPRFHADHRRHRKAPWHHNPLDPDRTFWRAPDISTCQEQPPARIQGDRTWLALAAHNIGPTPRRCSRLVAAGPDPIIDNVKKVLLLLRPRALRGRARICAAECGRVRRPGSRLLRCAACA